MNGERSRRRRARRTASSSSDPATPSFLITRETTNACSSAETVLTHVK
jgi:hypothetical protein